MPALLLLLALVPACSIVATPRTYRGNKVDADQLKELVVGTSTKADVSALIGSPTARAAFDDNQWIYISEITRTRVGRTPGVIDQNVTVLSFTPAGVLEGVKQMDKDDGRDVDVVSRSTPSPGSEATFMQQLFGNIGRFSTSPGGLSGQPSGLSAGSQGSGAARNTAQGL